MSLIRIQLLGHPKRVHLLQDSVVSLLGTMVVLFVTYEKDK